MKNDAEGIFLFRTEYIYLDILELPSEDEHYETNKRFLDAFSNKICY